MIDDYSETTPNGQKIRTMLEDVIEEIDEEAGSAAFGAEQYERC